VEELKKAYRRTATIGIAMVVSLVAYIAVVVVLQATQESFGAVADASLLRNIFFVIALATIVVVQVLRRRMYRTPSMVSSGGEPSVNDLIQKLVSTSIITFALAESIAIYGLVLFFLTGAAADFYALLAISLVTFTVFFPRYSRWEEWMKRRLRTANY
jgi:hypothetical protein